MRLFCVRPSCFAFLVFELLLVSFSGKWSLGSLFPPAVTSVAPSFYGWSLVELSLCA